MKYFILTYGCQMNHGDSERIAATLEKIGYKPADCKETADLIVVNACSVRQSAIDRIYGQIQNINQLKTKNHKLKTILTGCILPTDKKKMAGKFDLVLDIKALLGIGIGNVLFKTIDERAGMAPDTKCRESERITGINFPRRGKFMFLKNTFRARIYIPISTGCNNYCSYCVVPYTRGPEKNRPANEIINKARSAIRQNAKEIWLLGQNVNSYQFIDKSLSSESAALAEKEDRLINFPRLLKIINDIPGDFWIKFISSHPKDMSDELIKTIAECDKVCQYIHLPIQSGDNAILKKMNRRYTVARYKNLIKKIRKTMPGAAISTDIIVGFPGETKKQFERTAKLMREIKFDMGYLAQYSPRENTAAAKLKDDVPQKVKRQREKILNEILKKTALGKNKKYLGEIIDVLIEEIKDGFLFGKTKTHKSVKIELPKNKKGIKPTDFLNSIISVKISAAAPWGLKGRLIID